jgi:hypothetical protein
MADLGNTSVFSPTDTSNNSGTMPYWSGTAKPSTLDNAGRALQGAVTREWYNRNFTQTAGGTADNKTLTYTVTPEALYEQTYAFFNNTTNTSAVTLNINGLGSKEVKKPVDSGYVSLVAGDMVANQPIIVSFKAAEDCFVWINHSADSSSGTGGGYTFQMASDFGLLCDGTDETVKMNALIASHNAGTFSGYVVLPRDGIIRVNSALTTVTAGNLYFVCLDGKASVRRMRDDTKAEGKIFQFGDPDTSARCSGWGFINVDIQDENWRANVSTTSWTVEARYATLGDLINSDWTDASYKHGWQDSNGGALTMRDCSFTMNKTIGIPSFFIAYGSRMYADHCIANSRRANLVSATSVSIANTGAATGIKTTTVPIEAGATYVFECVVSNYVAGSLTPRIGGGTAQTGTAITANGSYTNASVIEVTAVSGNTFVEFRASADANMTVDSIKIAKKANSAWRGLKIGPEHKRGNVDSIHFDVAGWNVGSDRDTGICTEIAFGKADVGTVRISDMFHELTTDNTAVLIHGNDRNELAVTYDSKPTSTRVRLVYTDEDDNDFLTVGQTIGVYDITGIPAGEYVIAAASGVNQTIDIITTNNAAWSISGGGHVKVASGMLQRLRMDQNRFTADASFVMNAIRFENPYDLAMEVMITDSVINMAQGNAVVLTCGTPLNDQMKISFIECSFTERAPTGSPQKNVFNIGGGIFHAESCKYHRNVKDNRVEGVVDCTTDYFVRFTANCSGFFIVGNDVADLSAVDYPFHTSAVTSNDGSGKYIIHSNKHANLPLVMHTFATRAKLVTAVAAGFKQADGHVIYAAGVAYRWLAGDTSIADLHGLVLN